MSQGLAPMHSMRPSCSYASIDFFASILIDNICVNKNCVSFDVAKLQHNSLSRIIFSQTMIIPNETNDIFCIFAAKTMRYAKS